jgi:hypothetical protein
VLITTPPVRITTRHAQRLDGGGGGFPINANSGERVVARRRVFGDLLVAGRAIIADGGGLDEHARFDPGLLDGLHHGLARVDAAWCG